MTRKNLQKNAEIAPNDALPKEVLNPRQTAAHYTFRIYPASKALAQFVDYYWTMRWDLRGKPAFTAEVIPSPYTNLTFMPDGARITGVTTGKYVYELKDKGAIVGVKFKPGAFHAFYKKSLHTLTDTHIPASDVFKEIDDSFNASMLELPDNSAVNQAEKLLTAQNPVFDKNMQLVTGIIHYIESEEQPEIIDISNFVHLSERRLQEIFREYVGVGIKWILLRVRLIKAAELAEQFEKPDWTSVAHQLGYADQAHFTNDFKRIIGKSPSQYVAEIHRT